MSKKAKQQTDYENLGKILVNIYETGYLDAKKSYKQSFLKGLAGGLGGVIGATIVVAVLLWLLSFFKQIPLIGPLTNTFRQTVKERQQ